MSFLPIASGGNPDAQIAPEGGWASIFNEILSAFQAVRFRRNSDTTVADPHTIDRAALTVQGPTGLQLMREPPPNFRESVADFAGDLMRATDRGIRACLARFLTLLWVFRIVSRRGIISIQRTKAQFTDPFFPSDPFPLLGKILPVNEISAGCPK